MGRVVIAWEETSPHRAWVSLTKSTATAPSWYSAGPFRSASEAVDAARKAGVHPTHYIEITGEARRSPVPVQETTT